MITLLRLRPKSRQCLTRDLLVTMDCAVRMVSQDCVCLLCDDWVTSLTDSLDEGNVFEATPENRRQLGIFSASLLIFNRVIGTGIFATPSTILELSGSVGLSLFMWVIGTAIALAGTAVYLEWGTAIPRYATDC
jgi:hypothetical protein